MIPVRLSLQGVFSYRTRQELEFGRLLEGGLFGILGPTGGGKSALLEAIILALYGRAPRMEGRRLESIANPLTQRLEVELEFRLDAPLQAPRYRYILRAYRNPRGELKTERSAYRWSDGDWQPVECNVEDLLGISYENFCRAVILPQGTFDEFLRMEVKARTEVLTELFALHHYDVTEALRQLRERTRAEYESCQQQLQALAHATPEREQQLHEELQHCEDEWTRLTEELKQLRQQEEQLRQQRDRWQEYTACRQKLEELQQREPEMRRRRQRLERFQAYERQLRHLWERFQEERRQLEQSHRRCIQLQQRWEAAEQQRAHLELQFQQLRQHYEQRHRVQELVQLYRRAAQMLALQQEVQQLREHTDALAAQLEQARAQQQRLQHQWQQLRQRQQELRAQLDELQELIPWQERYEQLIGEQERLCQEEQQLAARRQELCRKVWSRLPELESLPISQPEGILERLQQEYARQEAQLRELRRRAQELERHRMLSALRSELHPGQPCPLCGALEHPSPFAPSPELAEQVRQLEQQQRDCEQRLEQLPKAIEWLRAQLQVLEERRHELTLRLQAVAEQLHKHRTCFRWDGWGMPDALECSQLRSRRDALRRQLSELERQLQQLEQQVRQLEQLLQERQPESEQLRQRFHERNAVLEQLRQELVQRGLEAVPENPSAEAEQLQHRLAELEQQYRQRESEYTQLVRTCEQLRGELSESQRQYEKQQARCAEVHAELQQRCAQLGIAVEALEELFATMPDLEREAQELEAFEHDYGRLQQRIAQLEPDARAYKLEEHERFEKRIEQLEQHRQELDRRLGAIQQKLEQLLRQLEERRQLEARFHALDQRRALLEQLAKVLRGQAFVDFVASNYLHSLCEQANLYLREWTDGALLLKVSRQGKSELRVLDLFHGGRERSVKTLSGGQLFQASLAMALALSDWVRAQSRLQRSLFFIDEGFGSLDRNNLHLVVQTLRTLARSGRPIGIITHREELKEELDAFVSVLRLPDRGSVLRPSWLYAAEGLPPGADAY